MKTLLVFVAAFGLPLAAAAQPVADSGKSTEVSELVVLARKATRVSALTVEAGCPAPGDSRWPSAWFDAPSDTKNKRTEESAGSRAFILRLIAGIKDSNPDYAHMGARLARASRVQLPLTKRWIECRGAFKDIQFLHVSRAGYDDFEVDFSNGAVEWEVKPLDSNQVAEHSALRFFYPQPVTKRFEALLRSMERGRPDYADLTPDSAAALRAEWPALQTALKDWGSRQSVKFLRLDDDGCYVFLVGYRNSRVVWEIAPLDADGKVTGYTYMPD